MKTSPPTRRSPPPVRASHTARSGTSTTTSARSSNPPRPTAYGGGRVGGTLIQSDENNDCSGTSTPPLVRLSTPPRGEPGSVAPSSIRMETSLACASSSLAASMALLTAINSKLTHSKAHLAAVNNTLLCLQARMALQGHSSDASLNAVVSALQHWYHRHSIRRYLSRQTWRRLAATTLQCWTRRIRLCLHTLCCGASAHASLVWGNRVIDALLRPRPTHLPTPRFPATRLGHVANLCHSGRGHNVVLVVVPIRLGRSNPPAQPTRGGSWSVAPSSPRM